MKNFIRNYRWFLAGFGAILLQMVFKASSILYETIYFKFIFQGVRIFHDYTFGLLPIPIVYVLFVGLIAYLFYRIRRTNKSDLKLVLILRSLFNTAGFVIFFFHLLWGFNYAQKPLAQRMDLQPIVVDSLQLFEATEDVLAKMVRLRSQISSNDSVALNHFDYQDSEENIRIHLEELMEGIDVPTIGRVRVRELNPKGILLRISTAGVYIPFVSEGHIDDGLHPLQKPFVLAHEMSHGYGITDEGECNFTAFMTCASSENPEIQYSGYYGLWRYMMINLRYISPSLYNQIAANLPEGIKKDYIAVREEMAKYPDILPEVRDFIYDGFLRSQGVRGGIMSYNTVVNLYMRQLENEKQ